MTILRGRAPRPTLPPVGIAPPRPISLRREVLGEFRSLGAAVDDGERYEDATDFRFSAWRATL